MPQEEDEGERRRREGKKKRRGEGGSTSEGEVKGGPLSCLKCPNLEGLDK